MFYGRSRPPPNTFITVQHIPFVLYCTMGRFKGNNEKQEMSAQSRGRGLAIKRGCYTARTPYGCSDTAAMTAKGKKTRLVAFRCTPKAPRRERYHIAKCGVGPSL